MKKLFLIQIQLLLSFKQTVILHSMMYTLIAAYAPISSCMDAKQLAQRQKELRSVYHSNETSISLDGQCWRRFQERRSTGDVVVLEPEYDSEYNGCFIVTIKEIHKGAHNTLIEKNYYEPSKQVSFVLGSTLVGTALYFLCKQKIYPNN